MDTSLLTKKFSRIGARLKIVERRSARRFSSSGIVSIDIASDRRGEFFEISPQPGADPEVEVIDVQPSDRFVVACPRNRRKE